MYNRPITFGLKIPNRFGKNVRKPQGDFVTDTVSKLYKLCCLSQHGTNRPGTVRTVHGTRTVRTVHGTNSPGGYEQSKDGTNSPWYEQSMVRIVQGTTRKFS